MPLLANIIGAGHLGKTIAHLLVKNQLVSIGAVCNTSEISARRAIEFIGDGQYCPTIEALPPADITFITTPDDLITEACFALGKNPRLKPGSVVLHCSGSLTSDALVAAREAGCSVASIHPMRSFAQPETSVQQYSGTYCAFEGDVAASAVVRSLFDSIGSITYEISKEKKSLYHAAGVFASNYLVTLSQQALSCLEGAGVEHDIAMRVISNIMRGTVNNLETTLSPQQSLTGPIQRGDALTISKHMQALPSDKKSLYSILGTVTLPLSRVDEGKKEAMKKALAVAEELPVDNIYSFLRPRL